jgi:tetratricopeptide (TPR) repeat protein
MKSGRIFFGLIVLFVVACPALAQEVGKIMSIVGTAEVLRKERWQSVSLDETLQAGDIVRTGPGSRVAVLLADGSQLKVNANSQLLLKQVASPTRQVAMRLMQSLLRLFSGEIWVRSLAEPLEIETFAATAILRGTELNLVVEATDTAHLAVVEGVVEFHNPEGSVRVGAREQALAKVGEAPRKTVLLNPLDAVQWSLYYPGIVSYRDYFLTELEPPLLQKRLTELERRAAAVPQDVNAIIALGEVLFDSGKRMEARIQFEKALRLAPRDPRAHMGLGWVYLEAGESEAALRQFHQAEPSTLMSLVGKTHALYRLDRFEEALEVIARAKQRFPKSPRPWTQAALVYLVQGRVPGALAELDRALRLDPKYALAHGLRSNIYLVRNQKERALEAAQQAVAANPLSPTAHLDLSLVKQAEFKLEEALQAARKAVALDPENPQALIQVSRLLFGQGEVDKAFELAERARRLTPQDPVVLSTWGFLQLAHERVNEAIGAFDRAIVQDSTRGEPHLGKGLALFRRGKTEDGVKEMRIATLLEPKVSLYHSYLGKAFYEVKRERLAQREYTLAKELDPRDPTPYLYDAIRKESVNRVVEAVEDLQKSIKLNNNRGVYRSRFLLDEDLATRGAALGRIYSELGFQQLALVEGWKSLNTDPTNYSAHRLLADSYSALPRHEIARVSELLQSQLLQPVNIIPVQPQLAERDLFILDGVGPAQPSLNEFNPLFYRNRLSLLASGVVGGNETYGDEVVQYGIWDPLSYNLGQFHFETDGWRDNNDLKNDAYGAFVQASLSPSTSVQAELRYTDTEQGDRQFKFDPDDFSPNLQRSRSFETARVGLHHAFSSSSDVLGSFVFRDVEDAFDDSNEFVSTSSRAREDDYLFELQYLHRIDRFGLTAGVGHTRADVKSSFVLDSFFESILPDIRTVKHPDLTHTSLYLYSNINYLKNLSSILGISVDFIEVEGQFDRNQVNPKIGLIWTPTPNTTVRLAAFRASKRAIPGNQTIEPTQVAGFNQFFDDFNGTRAWRYGLGVDQRFLDSLYSGIEVSARQLTVPFPRLLGEGADSAGWKEQFGRSYLYWAPHPWLALSVEYLFERFERELTCSNGIKEVKTHRVPLIVSLFHPSGFGMRINPSFVHQAGRFADEGCIEINKGSDNFWVVDVNLSYRLPKRWGILVFGIKNLFNESFHFQQSTNPLFNDREPIFALERQLIGGITLSF